MNPHKCVFCIETGRLLGFVVSKAGIRVDPSKVEAIVKLPPPSTLCQLQSLQGKANFLRRFIPNYAEIMKALWTYQTSVKTSTGLTPFQLVYELEAVLPIECKIPSLQIAIELLPATSEEEKHLLYLAQLDENRRDVALAIETHAKWIKAQYDRNVTLHNFLEGDLLLLYNQANDKLGDRKFVPMWHGPFIVKRKLAKGAYELVDFDGVSLGRPRNGLYLKRYYA
eukprot:PITA_31901